MINRIIDKLGRMSPDFISRLLVNIPFNIRHGKKVYDEFEEIIKESAEWNESKYETYIISHFRKIFQHAKKFKLYQKKYKEAGIFDLEINSLDDIKRIPILSKSEIRENIKDFKGYYSQNTGGTSGNPLSLFLDQQAWIREWVHYHNIWGQVGYKYTDAKFFFRGLNINDNFIKYDFQGNNYVINIFKNPVPYIEEFFKTLVSKKIKYFHGYPSAINDFLKKIDSEITTDEKAIIKEQIKYCFFSSEYPTPQIVKYLKNDWGFDFISCYGHSEVCVLAATKRNELEYFPSHTYGYVEVENDMLLGTSYHNFDMPLVRYNTGDLVRAKRYLNGIVKSFEVKEGREGDFILDKNGMLISLTGMFFGRHHKIFNYINHIQIFQENKGVATIFITHTREEKLDAPSLIDLKGIEIDFEFKYLKEPIRTRAGKVVLRVLELPQKNKHKTK